MGKFVDRLITASCVVAIVTLLAVLAAALTGCGEDDEPPYTWGQMAYSVSQGFCQAQRNCFGSDQATEDACVKHNYFHLCTIDANCGTHLDADAEEFTLACHDALVAINLDDNPQGCWDIFFGQLPPACDGFFDYKPEVP